VGLLDELEQEAQKRKATADDAVKRKAEREQIFRTQLDPGMVALSEYLNKLIASLKVLQPKKQLRYNLIGYGDIVGYVEHEYELKVTQQPDAKEITLSYPCLIANEECPLVEVNGPSKVSTVAGAFQRYHLGGLMEPKKDVSNQIVSAKFKAKGRITLTATFSADAESAVVKMQFVNFDSLGTATKTVPPAQLTDALFDEIGRYVTREPSSLFQEALPDSYRVQLRTKVQQEQIKRRWESKISAQQESDLEKMKREQSLAGKLNKLVSKPAAAAADRPAESASWLDRLKGLVKKDK
jgi:hypothetical protein